VKSLVEDFTDHIQTTDGSFINIAAISGATVCPRNVG
jgi:hypothetical protein